MPKNNLNKTIKASLPRGQRDIFGTDIDLINEIIKKVTCVYKRYGFEELSTPAFEFSDVLGKFLPDDDRPNSGVFSFQDDDEKWLSLRYDLTSPLARFVAENYDIIAKPYKRYQVGNVWRNEKPGPGRYREFIQLDADIVGSDNYLVDAELIMLACDSLAAIGLSNENYNVRVSNRKLLDAILEIISEKDSIDNERKLIILRAIDKLDRVGLEGVEKLLADGRKDASGDFTKGAKLKSIGIKKIMDFISIEISNRNKFISDIKNLIGSNQSGESAINELIAINDLLDRMGYSSEVLFDSSVVRGLGYYTGTMFEANISIENSNDKDLPVIGSIGGGGRYDNLISRFKKDAVPASGFSMGISRLCTILQLTGYNVLKPKYGPILILLMDKEYEYSYFQMAKELRAAGMNAEVYVGNSGMKAQMKYADRRNSPLVIIEGTDERAKGIVTIKNLVKGKEIASTIDNRDKWINNTSIQFEISREGLSQKIKDILGTD